MTIDCLSHPQKGPYLSHHELGHVHDGPLYDYFLPCETVTDSGFGDFTAVGSRHMGPNGSNISSYEVHYKCSMS